MSLNTSREPKCFEENNCFRIDNQHLARGWQQLKLTRGPNITRIPNSPNSQISIFHENKILTASYFAQRIKYSYNKRLKALEEEAEAGLATFVIWLTGGGSEDYCISFRIPGKFSFSPLFSFVISHLLTSSQRRHPHINLQISSSWSLLSSSSLSPASPIQLLSLSSEDSETEALEVLEVSALLEPPTASVQPRTAHSATASKIIRTQTSMDSVPVEDSGDSAVHHFLENKPKF